MPKKFIKSVSYARAGAEHAFRTQRNMCLHFFIGLVVIALAVWLKVSILEICILILTIFGVLAAETFNTSIEELVNMISPSHRKEAGVVKNIAAAAVLFAAIGAAVIGWLIFYPRLIK